jgi:hypothetical protein
MELIESWAFARAHAYRFGRHEYVLLMPNANRETCLALLNELLADCEMPNSPAFASGSQ